MTIIYPSFRPNLRTAAAGQTEDARSKADEAPRPLPYVGPADIAYIAYDLPAPVIHDILGNRRDGDENRRFIWEDLGLTALMGGYFIFSTAMLFRIASLATLFLR